MTSGKVVMFDDVRGYGFVTPDNGGDDVFIHVNDIDFDKRFLMPGAEVEFTVEDGDRGPKASYVRMQQLDPPTAAVMTPEPVEAATDSKMCDVLTTKEFLYELTETLITAVPTMTGHEVLQVRQSLLEKARKHGWVDD